MLSGISLGIKYLVLNIKEHEMKFSKMTLLEGYIGFSCLVLLGLTVFVIILLIFHTLLASKGLTSWEFISWRNITYLKLWPRKYGSPFTEGSTSGNLK